MKKEFNPSLPPSIVEEVVNGTETINYIAWSYPDAASQGLRTCIIMRVIDDTSTGITEITYAEGVQEYRFAWADRATYNYRTFKS